MATSTIEPLEARIAPATLTGNVLTYTDIDGDNVKVVFNHVPAAAPVAEGDFTFDNATPFASNDRMQLLSIDMIDKTGAGFTLTATPGPGGVGNSHANIGPADGGTLAIDGTGTNLGVISVDGDVTGFAAGVDGDTVLGLKSLTVLSLGRMLTAPATSSGIHNLGTLLVKTDVANAEFDITGYAKTITVGGSIVGSVNGGFGGFSIDGDAGVIKIGGSVLSAAGDAFLNITGKATSLTIGGSVIGGANSLSIPQIEIGGSLKLLSVAGDLHGTFGDFGGSVQVSGTLSTARIGGSLIGAAGMETGALLTGGDLTFLTIAGSIVGGNNGTDSGYLYVGGNAKLLKISGSVTGGNDASFSGALEVQGNATTIFIGHDLTAGNVTVDSGISAWNGSVIVNGSLTSMTLGGSLIGGRAIGQNSAYSLSSVIAAGDTLGTVKIGSIQGNALFPSYVAGGGPVANGQTVPVFGIRSLTVKGSVENASILAGWQVDFDFQNSGNLFTAKNSDAALGAITVVGSVFATNITAGTDVGADQLPGTADDTIVSGSKAKISSIKVGGTVGGSALDNTLSFYFYAPTITKVTVGHAVYTQTMIQRDVSDPANPTGGVDLLDVGHVGIYGDML